MPKAHASGEASPCAEGPSRRLVVGATTASPLLGIGAADPAVAACEAYLARHSEQQRLGHRWQGIENRAFAELNWPKLNRTQRARHREQLEMDALYDEMDALHEQNQALLASLPSIVATTHLGICGKLAVAAIEACPEDHPELHHLIASILRDYRALHGA
jgi:hypothetical protein